MNAVRSMYRLILAILLAWSLEPGLKAADDRVVVLSPHNESIRQEFGRAFAAWHQREYHLPAQVEWRDVGGSSEALRFLQSEFEKKTNGIGVDCFFGGGQEPYLVLAKKRFLQPYRLSEALLLPIPPKVQGLDVYDPEFRWYGAALSSFGILQNLRVQERLKLPAVTRWNQLADPRLAGWIGVGDPRSSGTMMVMFEGILQFNGWEKGWEVLSQMGGNARRFDRVSTTTAKDVTVGETAYGLAIDFYGFTQVAYAGKSNLRFVLPEDFATVSPDPIAILRGAPHLEIAQHFLEFVLGEPGQKLWFFPRGHPEGAKENSIERMPVRSDFYERYPEVSNIGSSPYSRSQAFHYNGKLARDRRDVLPALIGALLVDAHQDLQAAWVAVRRRGSKPEEVAELSRPPVSEQEVMALTEGAWKTNSFRLGKKIEWQNWAVAKYRRFARD